MYFDELFKGWTGNSKTGFEKNDSFYLYGKLKNLKTTMHIYKVGKRAL